jgi:hypothetical protein
MNKTDAHGSSVAERCFWTARLAALAAAAAEGWDGSSSIRPWWSVAFGRAPRCPPRLYAGGAARAVVAGVLAVGFAASQVKVSFRWIARLTSKHTAPEIDISFACRVLVLAWVGLPSASPTLQCSTAQAVFHHQLRN